MTSTEHFTSGRVLTHGECLHPAMKITEQADADNYLAAYVGYLEWRGTLPVNARSIALGNIGYFAGYFGDGEVAERMNRLFRATHPIFDGFPTDEAHS